MSDYDHRTTVSEAIRPSWDVDCDRCDWTDEADSALAAAILGLYHEREHLEAIVAEVRAYAEAVSEQPISGFLGLELLSILNGDTEAVPTEGDET